MAALETQAPSDRRLSISTAEALGRFEERRRSSVMLDEARRGSASSETNSPSAQAPPRYNASIEPPTGRRGSVLDTFKQGWANLVGDLNHNHDPNAPHNITEAEKATLAEEHERELRERNTIRKPSIVESFKISLDIMKYDTSPKTPYQIAQAEKAAGEDGANSEGEHLAPKEIGAKRGYVARHAGRDALSTLTTNRERKQSLDAQQKWSSELTSRKSVDNGRAGPSGTCRPSLETRYSAVKEEPEKEAQLDEANRDGLESAEWRSVQFHQGDL